MSPGPLGIYFDANDERYLSHSADPVEIEDLEKFLDRVIPAENGGSL